MFAKNKSKIKSLSKQFVQGTQGSAHNGFINIASSQKKEQGEKINKVEGNPNLETKRSFKASEENTQDGILSDLISDLKPRMSKHAIRLPLLLFFCVIVRKVSYEPALGINIKRKPIKITRKS